MTNIKDEFKEKIESELALDLIQAVLCQIQKKNWKMYYAVNRSTDRQSTVKVIDNSSPTHDSPLTTHDLTFDRCHQ